VADGREGGGVKHWERCGSPGGCRGLQCIISWHSGVIVVVGSQWGSVGVQPCKRLGVEQILPKQGMHVPGNYGFQWEGILCCSRLVVAALLRAWAGRGVGDGNWTVLEGPSLPAAALILGRGGVPNRSGAGQGSLRSTPGQCAMARGHSP
jgi:hypothetical protein